MENPSATLICGGDGLLQRLVEVLLGDGLLRNCRSKLIQFLIDIRLRINWPEQGFDLLRGRYFGDEVAPNLIDFLIDLNFGVTAG
jgi:hypothetical protein